MPDNIDRMVHSNIYMIVVRQSHDSLAFKKRVPDVHSKWLATTDKI